jgi:hypothetical protein
VVAATFDRQSHHLRVTTTGRPRHLDVAFATVDLPNETRRAVGRTASIMDGTSRSAASVWPTEMVNMVAPLARSSRQALVGLLSMESPQPPLWR